MALYPSYNLVKVTPSLQNASDTTVTFSLSDYQKLPVLFPFNMVWWNSTTYPDPSDDPNVEIVQATSGNPSSHTLTITRAAESIAGQTAVAYPHNTAGSVYKMILSLTAAQMVNISNVIVGYRSAYANFTTVGNDISFTITPPSDVVNGVLHMVIGSQVMVQGVSNDFTVSENVVTLTSQYSGPAGAPVVIIYTY